MNKNLAALTIFLGSFLSFGVQPLIGRTIIAAFGGTAAVWIVCLCAFQVLLLAGYFYADRMAANPTRRKMAVHLALLFAAAAGTALVAYRRAAIVSRFADVAHPILGVLLCVVVLIAVPYILLGSNASLVQALASRGGRGAYRLYSVSNVGSIGGLLAYPFVFEPLVSVTGQWLGLSLGIAAYAALLWRLANGAGAAEERRETVDADNRTIEQSNNRTILYLVIPAVSCFLLNSLTTHFTTDVMPMPLIWTLTLTVFLLSYVIGFSGKAEKHLVAWAVATLANGLFLALIASCLIWRHAPFQVVLAACLSFLLLGCTFLHTWLYQLRPEAGRLTRYYLFGSIGGAVGGTLASIVFPLVSKSIVEYPVSLVAVGLLIAVFAAKRRVLLALAVLSLAAGGWLYTNDLRTDARTVAFRGRGFFGVTQVKEAKARTREGEGFVREFVHGTTVHGIQARLPGKERMPTTYFTPDGCGYAITAHPNFREGKPMRVCLVGLGLGVLYAYAREGDYYRGYEISRESMAVATDTNLFTFVSGCPARHDEILQDARTGLEREAAAGEEPYDVIVIDAFSGDSQPYHISTREAFELYLNRLKPDGVLCVHITNWHLQLEPFIKTVGDTFGLPLLGFCSGDDYGRLKFATKAAFFCRQPEKLGMPPAGVNMIDFAQVKPMPYLPTDEKGSFIDLIKW